MRTVLALVFLVACRSTPLRTDEPAPAAPAGNYSFVFLSSDPRGESLAPDVLEAAMAGHFENMGRLATAGQLLCAGPLGEPRVDPRHRGIFLFDEADEARARALAESDPSIRAGVFSYELVSFTTAAALRRVPALERAAREARLAADPDGPEWEGRMWVLVSSPAGAAALEAIEGLVEEGLVPFHGSFGGAREGQALFLLDCADVSEAREMLAFASEDGALGFRLHPWYASAVLSELAR